MVFKQWKTTSKDAIDHPGSSAEIGGEREMNHPSTAVFERKPVVRMTHTLIQRKSGCNRCSRDENELFRWKVAGGIRMPSGMPPVVHDVLQSTGQPMEAKTRTFFESRFGQDFSRVRVHIGSKASESAQAMNALAYTVGEDIVFGNSRYAPHTTEGKRLIAHELTHVAQQAGTKSTVQPAAISWEGDASEKEADQVANTLVNERTMKPSVGSLPPQKYSLSTAEVLLLQRATDQPELQVGIGVGLAFGGATVGSIVTCLMRAGPVQNVGFIAYRIAKITTASGAEKQRLIDELVMEMLIPPGFGFTSACDCFPPQIIAAVAKWGLRNYPDALAHIEHYLTGGGTPIVEDIPRMFREDHGLQRRIEYGIERKGTLSGDLKDWVTQDTWSTKNWDYSLGNVDLFHYEILPDSASKAANAAAGDGTASVRVSIRDPYEWHPDVGRAIPCLHTGMEAMKASGAKDFLSIGDGAVRLSVPKSLLPLP